MNNSKISPKTESKQQIRLFVRRTAVLSASLAAASSLASLALVSQRAAISIASGWLISTASFLILVITISNAFTNQGKGSTPLAMLGIVKLAILGLALWWLITNGIVTPLAFSAGFSTMVIALIVEGVRLTLR